MKKLTAILLALALVLSLAIPPVFAAPFDDDITVTDPSSVEDINPTAALDPPEGENTDPVSVDGEDGGSPTVAAPNPGNGKSSGGGSLETMVTGIVGGDSVHSGNTGTKQIPDTDSFSGNNVTFDGNDGSKTTVYDNGSILTDNGDGTKTGVDGDGTYITVDSDGTETYHFSDGTIGKKYSDGRKEQIEPDGSKLIQRADGTIYSTHPEGYSCDRDDEGNIRSVYFDNGQRIDFYDENGDFKTGEYTITGPNGETVTYKCDANDSEDGFNMNEISFTAKGNGLESGFKLTSDGEGGGTYEKTLCDGSKVSVSINGEENIDVHAVSGDGTYEAHMQQTENKLTMTIKDENGSISLDGEVTKDGTKVQMSATGENGTATMNVTLDEDGNLKSGSFKHEDGSYLTRNEDGSIEFSDPKTGAYLKTDGDGNYVSLHVPMKNNSSYDYSDGTGVLVDNDNGYKVMWTHDENGNLVIAAPSGKYTVDENGNLFKDGQPVMVDGKQVNVETGFNRGEFSEAPIDFMEAICGTYLVSGTGVLTGGPVYDDEGPETTFTEVALHVSQAGDNAVQIDVEGVFAGSGEVSAESPTVSYTDSKGYEVTVTFTVNNNGGAHADMKIFGDLTITGTDDYFTETITLSGDK